MTDRLRDRRLPTLGVVRSVNRTRPDANGNVEVTDLSGGAWTAYTPTVTNLTLGNGTVSGAWTQVGKTVHFRVQIVLGSTSAMGSAPTVSLPVAAKTSTNGAAPTIYVDAGTDQRTGGANITGLVAGFRTPTGSVTATSPFTWAVNDEIYVSGTYETA